MKEIVVHGRGAQGAVTAAYLISIASFYDGKESQSFPMFGVERCGAPVQAFARISDKQITLRSQIYDPDYIIVLDPTLVPLIKFSKSAKVIINTKENIKNTKTIDATSIALEVLKAPFVNTAMVAAFAAYTHELSLDSILKSIEEIFKEKPELIEKNKELIKRIYEKIKNENN